MYKTNAQAKIAARCYNCDGGGKFARNYPTRHQKEAQTTNSSEKVIEAEIEVFVLPRE
jgi:hypothetical protein